MGKPYVYERQAEYWTSRGIEEYFLDAGFQVMAFPVTQLSEREVPFDFVFFEATLSKMFGLQYKALYRNDRDHWPLDEKQHLQLQCYKDWAYYCLSEVRDPLDFRVAIHRARFVSVRLDFRPRIVAGDLTARYYRWGGFVEGLHHCTTGLRVSSPGEVVAAVRRTDRNHLMDIDEHLVDLFVANLEKRRMLHFHAR